MKKENIVIYQNGELELKVSVDKESIWIRAEDIAMLFNVQRPAIVKHIGNIYKTNELDEKSTCSKMEQVTKDGKKRNVKFYNLDIIISVGYRVNSFQATKFRQWATKVLNQYIYKGYAINSEKITHQRFRELEKDVDILKNNVQKINALIREKQFEIKQGIFYNGQIYDAYVFINDLLKSAQREVILIDNYIDNTVLTLFSKFPELKFMIITKAGSKQLELDIKKYNAQYNNLIIKTLNKFHDRFLILDKKETYHFGASLKDLGKKVFAFSRMDIDVINLSDITER